ncbi:MAG: phosphatase PAP2 family protein [Candidatus Ornithomonoglobus sp.]
MPRISALGNGGALWIAIAVCCILNRYYRKTGIIILAGLLIGALIGNIILKPFIARPRPCWVNSSVSLLIPTPRDYSFPSGHTLSAFITAFILMYIDRRLGCAVMPIAVLIAFSRLYLYVHYPSDVFGGMILGMLIAKLVYVYSIHI